MCYPKTFLCGWCEKPTEVGDWCSMLCFETWQRTHAEKPAFVRRQADNVLVLSEN